MATASVTFGTFAGTGWSNAANAASSDNVYATVQVADSGTCAEFTATGPSGVSEIADGATISAIRMYCECSCQNAGKVFAFTQVYLVKAGTTQSGATNKATGGSSSTTDATVQFGASDLWGVALTGADVKNSGFGVSLVVQNNTGDEGSSTFRVDHVRGEIDYTNPVPGNALLGLSHLGGGSL